MSSHVMYIFIMYNNKMYLTFLPLYSKVWLIPRLYLNCYSRTWAIHFTLCRHAQEHCPVRNDCLFQTLGTCTVVYYDIDLVFVRHATLTTIFLIIAQWELHIGTQSLAFGKYCYGFGLIYQEDFLCVPFLICLSLCSLYAVYTPYVCLYTFYTPYVFVCMLSTHHMSVCMLSTHHICVCMLFTHHIGVSVLSTHYICVYAVYTYACLYPMYAIETPYVCL